ncbi:methyltransferase-like protein 27 [Watersipora subatra]|uniref:methyltransferase-like protein 27 n=1 Tax=Watersipora subatra TaxID=2589382 RepID=UPI00355B674D
MVNQHARSADRDTGRPAEILEKLMLADWHEGLALQLGGSTDADISDAAKVEFYDRNAAVYDEDMEVYYEYTGATQTANALHKYLKGNLDAKILDVGGGTGLVIKKLKDLAPYKNADGLDPAGEMLILGKQNGLYDNIFPQCFTLDSDIPSNSYDAVCSSGAYVPGHIKAATISKLHDIVKPGGYIIIVMRKSYTDTDADLIQLLPLIGEMVTCGKVQLIEQNTFEKYFKELEGLRIVLQKL